MQDLKAAVETANGTPADQQRLIYSGRVLKDGDKLADYGIKVGRQAWPGRVSGLQRAIGLLIQ